MTKTSSKAGRKPNPAGQLTLLLSLGSLVLGGLTYQYLTRPVMAQTATVRAEADTTERKLEAQRLLVSQLPQLRDENARLEASLKDLRREFPNAEQLAQRINDIEETALALGMQIGGFQRSVEDSGIQGVDRLKLSTAVLGSYGKLITLIDTISAKDRFTTVDGLEMSLTPQGLGTRMDIYSYMLRPTPPATPAPGAPAPAEGAATPPQGAAPTPGDVQQSQGAQGGTP